MADSFFELKNSYPEQDGECVDLDEEEYDALNDETFGSDAYVPEEDWEDTHNLLSAAAEISPTVDDDDVDLDVANLLGRLGLDDEASGYNDHQNGRFEIERQRAHTIAQQPQNAVAQLLQAPVARQPQNIAAHPPHNTIAQLLQRSPPMPLYPPSFAKVPTVEELEREFRKPTAQSYPPPPQVTSHMVPSPQSGLTSAGLLPFPRRTGFPPSPNSPGPPPGMGPLHRNIPPGLFPPGLDMQVRAKGLSPQGNRGPMPPLQGKPMGLFSTPPPHLPPEMMMRPPQDKLGLRLMFPPPMGFPMVPPHPGVIRFLPPTARNLFPPMFPQMRLDTFGRNNFPPHPLLQQQYLQKMQMLNLSRLMRPQQPSNRRNSETYDEYAKLMNNRERNWLLNIQLMQLATDKPHVDDYYYTMWKKKHPAPRLRNGFHNHDQRKKQSPFFANNRADGSGRERKDSEGTVATSPKVYVPLQFENSLGKLQCGSVTAPRMIIDMDVVSEPQNGSQAPQVHKDQRKTKKILLELERLYLLVMEAEEIEETPEEDHDLTSDAVIAKALTGFLNEERFLSFLCIRKGKTLLLRCLSRLNDWELPLLTDLWTRLLKGFPTIVRRDRDDALLPKLYPYFRTWASCASWPNLLIVSRSLLSNSRDGRTSVMRASPAPSRPLLTYILANQFGVSVVSRLVLQGEMAADIQPDIDTVHHWKTFVEELVKSLSSVDSIDSCALGHWRTFTSNDVNLHQLQVIMDTLCKLTNDAI